MFFLLVDDEIWAMQGLLNSVDWARLGFSTIYTATSYEKAVEIMNRVSIDFMVCDVEMPGRNGLDLVEWTKKNHPETTSLMLTCHDDFQFVKRALVLGCRDYLLKPVEPEALMDILAGLIVERTTRLGIDPDQTFGSVTEEGAKIVKSTVDGISVIETIQLQPSEEKKGSDTVKQNTNIPVYVTNTMEYIRDHMEDNLSVEMLASRVYMNSDYLSRKFKKATGLSLSEYLIEERMKEAGRLLKEGESVSRAAAKVGCMNFSYFSRQFKKKYGCSPREYQAKNT